MLLTPEARPDTIPLRDPIVATARALLLHEPPVVVLLNVVVLPTHTLVVPVIAAGSAFTVTIAVMLQPVLMV
jgi:hypothetical protein